MDADPDVKLQREVEIPRSRSGGAAVVVVSFCALFVALGSSALMVRVRMQAGCPAQRTPVAAAPVEPERAVVPVELMSQREAQLAAERALGDADRELLATFRLTAAHDPEAALELYNTLPEVGAARRLLADEHTSIADDWLATQVTRLTRELDRRDCGAVDERLARMRRLLPDRRLPDAMDGCGR